MDTKWMAIAILAVLGVRTHPNGQWKQLMVALFSVIFQQSCIRVDQHGIH